MPLDNAAASNALSLLNGIDYGAVIGAPLQAAITAQAMAARSTWEFIQQVGLQTNQDGTREAVNVSFTYMSGGRMVKLIVPILTIVPIPAIEVTNIDISFKASINAAASQASEQSESSTTAGSLGVAAKVGWGPFSASANFKANYSSKKDSKATQDSRYSVEYTQDVRVQAGQAGVPAGLSVILSILSAAATGASPDGELTVSPAVGELDVANLDSPQLVTLRLVGSSGLALANTAVTLTPTLPKGVPATALTVGKAPLNMPIDPDPTTGAYALTTGNDGSVSVLLGVSSTGGAQLQGKVFEVDFSADDSGKPLTAAFPIRVVGALPAPQDSFTFNPSSLPPFAAGGQQNVTVTVKNQAGEAVRATDVTFNSSNTKLTATQSPVPTDGNGTASFTLQWDAAAKTGDTAEVTFSVVVDGQQVPSPAVTVTVS